MSLLFQNILHLILFIRFYQIRYLKHTLNYEIVKIHFKMISIFKYDFIC